MSKWEYRRFSDFLDFFNGKTTKICAISGYGKYAVYGSNGIIGYTDEYMYSNAIVIGRVGAYCGSVCICKDKFWATDNTIVAKNRRDIADLMFCFYVLQNANLNRYAGGAAQPLITQRVLKKIYVRVPNITIQRKIADTLSAYDDLIENNNRRIELLEKAAQDLYKEWFVRFRFPGHEAVKFENGLPCGWEHVRLGDAIEIIDGDRGNNYPKQDEFMADGFCVFLNTGNVTKKGFDFSSVSYISAEKDGLLRKGKLKRNDIVLTTRGTVGNSAFYNVKIPFDNMRINSGMVILRDINVVSPEYVFCALNDVRLLKSMELYSSGSAQPQLPIRDMKRIKIIRPTQGIMGSFTKMTSADFIFAALLSFQNQNLKKQRDLLLPRLMSGKLEV